MPNSGQSAAALPPHLNAVGWQESPNREFDPAPQPLPVRALLHQPTQEIRNHSGYLLAGPFSGPAFFSARLGASELRPSRKREALWGLLRHRSPCGKAPIFLRNQPASGRHTPSSTMIEI